MKRNPFLFALTVLVLFMVINTGCDDRSPLANGAAVDQTDESHKKVTAEAAHAPAKLPRYSAPDLSSYGSRDRLWRTLSDRNKNDMQKVLDEGSVLFKILEAYDGSNPKKLEPYFGKAEFAKDHPSLYARTAYLLAISATFGWMSKDTHFELFGKKYECTGRIVCSNTRSQIRADWGNRFYPGLTDPTKNASYLAKMAATHDGHPEQWEPIHVQELSERSSALTQSAPRLDPHMSAKQVEAYMDHYGPVVPWIAPGPHRTDFLNFLTGKEILCHKGVPLEKRKAYLQKAYDNMSKANWWNGVQVVIKPKALRYYCEED